MSVEKHFVKEGIKEAEIEEFLREKFNRAGYSHIEIQRTPLGTRIMVFANRPGLVIGKSGSRIKEITDEIQKRFEMENPMLDVREIENPNWLIVHKLELGDPGTEPAKPEETKTTLPEDVAQEKIKQEDETISTFKSRLFSEIDKTLNLTLN